MGREIERKFLIFGDGWRNQAEGIPIRQGYLSLGPHTAIRVRLQGSKAILNIKQATLDIERDEFEYEIPVADAQQLLDRHCIGEIIDKTRYKIPIESLLWEVDEFHGANEGLIVAEVELENRDQEIELPEWVGEEVSGDPRYLNANLCQSPFTTWTA